MCMCMCLCDYKPPISGCLEGQKSVKSHGARVTVMSHPTWVLKTEPSSG